MPTVEQALSTLEQVRAEVVGLRVQLRQAMYQLNLLLGSPPRDLLQRLGESEGIPAAPTEIAVGVPADLLRRRPDIRLAERQAAAQSAQIGVARAQLFPAFFLSTSSAYLIPFCLYTSGIFNPRIWAAI